MQARATAPYATIPFAHPSIFCCILACAHASISSLLTHIPSAVAFLSPTSTVTFVLNRTDGVLRGTNKPGWRFARTVPGCGSFVAWFLLPLPGGRLAAGGSLRRYLPAYLPPPPPYARMAFHRPYSRSFYRRDALPVARAAALAASPPCRTTLLFLLPFNAASAGAVSTFCGVRAAFSTYLCCYGCRGVWTWKKDWTWT